MGAEQRSSPDRSNGHCEFGRQLYYLSSDEWTSYMADDAMFWDRDHNGYYDYIEIGGGGGVCVYDPETDTWQYRKYNFGSN